MSYLPNNLIYSRATSLPIFSMMAFFMTLVALKARISPAARNSSRFLLRVFRAASYVILLFLIITIAMLPHQLRYVNRKMAKITRNILKKMGSIRPPSNSAIYESPFGMLPEFNHMCSYSLNIPIVPLCQGIVKSFFGDF